jgi:hypothetical protein
VAPARIHRFRPRYRGIALGALGLGGSLTVATVIVGLAALPLAAGLVGVTLGAAYLASPTWRLAVTVDDTGLAVGSPRGLRFRLAWAEVTQVIASPTTRSCFVDGGAPERSLLVPGDGAPAPYDLEDRAALFDAVLAHVPADKVRIVESLDKA